MKTCSKCGVKKPADRFHMRRKSKDGLHSQCNPCKREAQREAYIKNRNTHLQRSAEQRALYPERRKAYHAVANAVAKGILTKPEHCTNCGRKPRRIEGHHHRGYVGDAKIDVIWLCTSCHRAAEK